MRHRIGIGIAAVALLLGSGGLPAQATTEGTATFIGAWAFAPAPTLVTTTASAFAFATTFCVDAGVHVAEPKALTDAGNCTLAFAGTYVGTCFFGVGTGPGTYTDATGQLHTVTIGFIVAGPLLVITGAITKVATGASGSIEGVGRYAPGLTPALNCPTAIDDGYVNYTF